MPTCVICDEKFYGGSDNYDPPEPCPCGEEFIWDLWVDSGSWQEWWRLVKLQKRWQLARLAWRFSEWVLKDGA